MSKKDNSLEIKQLIRRGTALLQRGRHNSALEPLEKAHRLDEDNFDAALNLAAAQIMAKKFKQAGELLEQWTDREGGNAMLWTNLGAAYLGNPVLADETAQLKAVDAFVRALQIDPKAPNVAYNIGLIHRDRKEFQAAIKWFKIAQRTNPNDEDAAYWIDELMKKLDE